MRVEKIPLDIIDAPDNRHRIEFDENELLAELSGLQRAAHQPAYR